MVIGPGVLQFVSQFVDGMRGARTGDEEAGCGGGDTGDEKEKIFHEGEGSGCGIEFQ